MLVTDKDLQSSWKRIAKRQVEADSLITPDHAFIFALGIASNGSGEADAIVYDGHDASGGFHIHLYCVDEAMDWIVFNTPMYFNHGIYVDIGTNVDQVVVQYLPVKE